MARGPDFASRFAVARAGCGTGCSMLWIVDVATGRTEEPRLGDDYGDELAVDYRANSGLLRAHWIRGGRDDGRCVVYSAVWDGARFRQPIEQTYGPAESCDELGWGG